MTSLPFHPAVVHFPIAIFVISGILGIISIFTHREFIKNMLLWLFIFGIVFTVAAIFTGLMQEDSLVHNDAIHELLEKHETNAYVAAVFFIIMFAWFLIRKKINGKSEYILWVILLLAGTGLLGYQNYLGGEMVYGQGAAVRPMEKIIQATSTHEHHHDEENH